MQETSSVRRADACSQHSTLSQGWLPVPAWPDRRQACHLQVGSTAHTEMVWAYAMGQAVHSCMGSSPHSRDQGVQAPKPVLRTAAPLTAAPVSLPGQASDSLRRPSHSSEHPVCGQALLRCVVMSKAAVQKAAAVQACRNRQTHLIGSGCLQLLRLLLRASNTRSQTGRLASLALALSTRCSLLSRISTSFWASLQARDSCSYNMFCWQLCMCGWLAVHDCLQQQVAGGRPGWHRILKLPT